MRVLVGFDGSDGGRDALELTRVLAEATGASVLVVTSFGWALTRGSSLDTLSWVWELGVGALLAKGADTADMMSVPQRQYGGAVPLRVRGAGVVGWFGVSGLPQLEDHQFVVEVLTRHLGQSGQ